MKLYKKLLKRIEDGNPIYCNETFAKDLEAIANKHFEQLAIQRVVSSCVDKDTLIKDLNDKRIVGVTLNENMWHYCRKETAEHLLDKYEIKPK